ncbi:unnamed protein product [Spirodela intermedia]|uniref:Uncharacterized protein n=1 Tax=Spirodela intermedia TaxID=51605 RepID=A0A7I8I8I9_SPIIN|nr:unnamed protein product [Spirodela intermedia]CAA6653828.1 unnamed protein product [Spirodela intermedia]
METPQPSGGDSTGGSVLHGAPPPSERAPPYDSGGVSVHVVETQVQEGCSSDDLRPFRAHGIEGSHGTHGPQLQRRCRLNVGVEKRWPRASSQQLANGIIRRTMTDEEDDDDRCTF